MSKLRTLWEEHRGLFLLVTALLLSLQVLLILYPVWVMYLMVAGTIMVVAWLVFDSLLLSKRRKRQVLLDEHIAAQEGIADRKREWLQWTQELSQAGIDRYKLPFYLLVGEPQSGKSIMLKNSGLHFPLGQNKLSGPGGTRGCDWWFTEEAVVLDLAGRLFTHESGSSDASEWKAFLELLANYRPLSPANGILLVLPCDSLLQDSEAESERKAIRIRESLETLVNQLEAKLPIYVVLTKADKVFGFAESVHRMERQSRRQMFGWSRPAAETAEPFGIGQFERAFGELKSRAKLLQDQALGSARMPDAQSEVDRLYAFPEEFGTLEAPLEAYIRHIFVDSNVGQKLFMRGIYLTSGLQKGAPIGQACAALMGGTSEADARDLEGLFSKQRAYFIKDLIQRRVFQESGLVRPTSQRVERSRRRAFLGYGSVAAIAVAGALWMGYATISSASPNDLPVFKEALASTGSYVETEPAARRLEALLETLDRVEKAILAEGLSSVDRAGKNNLADFEELHAELCAADLGRLVRSTAEAALEEASRIEAAQCGLEALQRLCQHLDLLLLGNQSAAGNATGSPSGAYALGRAHDRKLLFALMGPAWTESGPGSLGSRLERALRRHGRSRGSKPLDSAPQDGPSPALLRTGANLARLLKACLGDVEFGSRQPAQDADESALERVAMLYRVGASLRVGATRLRDPAGSPSVLNGEVSECDTIAGSYAELQKGLARFEAWGERAREVAPARFQGEYASLSAMLPRVLGACQLQLPDAWPAFGAFADELFASQGQGPAFCNWRQLDPVPGETEPRGCIQLPDAGQLMAALGLDETLIAGQIIDCRQAVVQPGSALDPRALMEFIDAKLRLAKGLDSTANSERARRLLRSQVLQVKQSYLQLYLDAKESDGALLQVLGAGDQVSGKIAFLGFDLDLLDHLLRLRALLLGVDPETGELGPWIRALEACLEARLGRANAALAQLDSVQLAGPEARRFAQALTRLFSNNLLRVPLSNLLPRFLKSRRAALLEVWDPMQLGRVLAELHAEMKLEVAFGHQPGAPANWREELDLWLREALDLRLGQGIQDLAEGVRKHWSEQASMGAEADLKTLAAALKGRLEWSRMHGELQRGMIAGADFGLALRSFDKLQRLLGAGLATHLPRLMDLSAEHPGRPLSMEASSAKLAGLFDSSEVDELRAMARRFAGDELPTTLLSGAQQRASALLLLLGEPEQDAMGDGARCFLRTSVRAFDVALGQALLQGYGAQFEALLREHQAFLSSALFHKQAEASAAAFGLDDMQKLLGAAHQLRRDFGLQTPGAPTASPANQGWQAFEEGSSLAAWDAFLYQMAQFFDVGSSGSMAKLRLVFMLRPADSSFWKSYGSFKEVTLGYWWPFGTDEFVTVGPKALGKRVGWNLESDSQLYMAWNDSVVRPEASLGRSLELKGCFAPLALVWHYGEREQAQMESCLLRIPLGEGEVPLLMELPAGLPALPGKLPDLSGQTTSR